MQERKEADTMKQKFKLQDLDCANCAAKMEEAINKLDSVDKAVISFMTQRLTIETENDMDEVLDQCQKAIDKVEDDCRIVR